jgi:hypothetical protein
LCVEATKVKQRLLLQQDAATIISQANAAADL